MRSTTRSGTGCCSGRAGWGCSGRSRRRPSTSSELEIESTSRVACISLGGPKLGDGTEIAQTGSPRWRDCIVFVSSSLLNAMKFGKKLIEQASPQWADAYLPYKSLKETIKLFQGAGPATNKAEGGRALKFPLTHSCKATGIEPSQPGPRQSLSSLTRPPLRGPLAAAERRSPSRRRASRADATGSP